MRGARAKRLRRAAYGDLSLRNPRAYVKVVTRKKVGGLVPQYVNRDTLLNAPGSPRAIYQAMKGTP